jgi:subtilisin family serine protease
VILAFVARIGSADARVRSPVGPVLQAVLGSQPPTQPTSVIVVLKTQENVRAIGGSTRAERQRNVIQALQRRADGDQQGLRALLGTLRQQGHVQSFTPLWIYNAIIASGDAEAINQLARSPAVGAIVPDVTIQAPLRTAQSSTSSPPQANVSAINAPALWALGYQGQGIVVANMDTGVDNTHPDLLAQWRGGTNSWYDPYGQHAAPTDLNGHGTWTMGVMVGGGASGATIGVAPQAHWIAVKIFNDSGVATTSAIHQGFQWLLDPDGSPTTADAPNVVNNSWALSNINGCDLSFAPDLQALVAVGITPVFAAGNYGPNGSTSMSPPNNPDAFAVGAVDNNSVIYSGSSRGPTSCGGTARSYPDVVAPGVAINTTDLYAGYWSVTGTSLAAPHVAGALALLLNVNSNLTVAQQRAALASTALDLGTAGADNTFGAGRIDVLAAYNSLAGGGAPTNTPTNTPTSTNTPTPTSTNTPTNTPTSTNTPTRTPTNTPTSVSMSTPTNTPTRTPTPTPATDAIFADGFETGTLSAWSAANTGGGRLSVSTSAALVGTRGMQAQVNSTSGIYVIDTRPNNEPSYHARFYFHPNSATTGASQHDIFTGQNSGGTIIFRVQYRLSSGQYQVRARVQQSSGTTSTNWFTISNAAHPIEIAWQSGASTSFSLYVDGTLKQALSGLNTSAYLLDAVRLGPSSINPNSAGTEYFDAFASTHTTYIGP